MCVGCGICRLRFCTLGVVLSAGGGRGVGRRVSYAEEGGVGRDRGAEVVGGFWQVGEGEGGGVWTCR